MRRRALALAAALLLAGCASEGAPETGTLPDEATVTTGDVSPTTGPQEEPPPAPTGTSTTGRDTTPPPAPTTEPRVTTPADEPARTAPTTRVQSLRFDRIFVYKTDNNRFGGRANVTNEGGVFLNGPVFAWRILDAGGRELDRGAARLATLAPGETSTIELVGRRDYREGWARVAFTRVG